MAKSNEVSAEAGTRHSLPSYIILLAEWAGHPAGRVFHGDPDLIGKLDIEGARYREATDFERRIGGFVD
jgi:hypothetical protein